MERFKKLDVGEILEMIEKELDSVPRLDKIQKMKMRAKIRQQENWLLAYPNPTTVQVMKKLEGRLSDVLRQYPHGFFDELEGLLKRKVKRLKEDRQEPRVSQ